MTDLTTLDWPKRLTTEERLRTALEGYEAAAKRCVVLLRPVVLASSEATEADQAALNDLEKMMAIGRGEADRVMMLASRSLDDAYADRHRALNGRAGARALVATLLDALNDLVAAVEKANPGEPALAEARRVAETAGRTRSLWRRQTWWWLGGEKQLPEDEQKPKRLTLLKGGEP